LLEIFCLFAIDGSLLEETRNDDAELTLEQRATNVHGPSVGSNLGRAEAESKGYIIDNSQ
jgi:hypothetical protein